MTQCNIFIKFLTNMYYILYDTKVNRKNTKKTIEYDHFTNYLNLLCNGIGNRVFNKNCFEYKFLKTPFLKLRDVAI